MNKFEAWNEFKGKLKRLLKERAMESRGALRRGLLKVSTKFRK
jgi:hypothetical protein